MHLRHVKVEVDENRRIGQWKKPVGMGVAKQVLTLFIKGRAEERHHFITNFSRDFPRQYS
jgi:hypothetical protein